MSVILHITRRERWERARQDGLYRADTLETEGFLHCSAPAQVLGPANAFFRGQTGLVLLVIDARKVRAPIRYEAADGDRFPHLYGLLNVDAVVRVVPFPPQEDGTFVLPSGLDEAEKENGDSS